MAICLQILLAFSRLSVFAQTLTGQYEFWDYLESSYVYDYTGGGRHAIASYSNGVPVLTDRGLYISDGYSLKFPQNNLEDFQDMCNDMVVSVLFYPKSGKKSCLISLVTTTQSVRVCFENITGNIKISIEGALVYQLSTNISFSMWRLYTFRFYQVSSNTFLYVYFNGDDDNTALITLIRDFTFTGLSTRWELGSDSIEGLLYQIWWHCQVPISIKTLTASMFDKGDASCGSLYTLSPYKICLSNQIDKFKNSNNQECTNCSSSNQSCNNDGSCIVSCVYRCISTLSCRSYSTPACPASAPDICTAIPMTDHCYSCNPGWLMSSDTPGMCVISVQYCITFNTSGVCTSCQPGYYLTSDNPPNCMQCPVGCLRCYFVYPDQVACTECSTGLYLQLDTPTCSSNCPEFSTTTTTNKCMRCPSNCKLCSYKSSCNCTECSECLTNFYIQPIANSVPVCVNTCYNGYYIYTEVYNPPSCKICTSNCINCASINECSICAEAYFLTEYKTCSQCMTGCKECTNLAACTVCYPGYYLDNTVCYRCLQECKLCDSSNQCSQCNSGRQVFTIDVTTKCLLPCNNPTALSASETDCADFSVLGNSFTYCQLFTNEVKCSNCTIPNTCSTETTCPTNCKSCYTNSSNGSEVKICSVCFTNYFLQPDQQSCLATCPEFYYGHSGFCIQCVGNCRHCTNSNNCSECSDNLYILDNPVSCVASCPVSRYFSVESPTRRCASCISNCETCTNSTDCQRCIIGKYLASINGIVSCQDACPAKYYPDINNICKVCQVGCNICELSGGQEVCRDCSVGYLLRDNKCVELVCDPNCLNCVINKTTLRCDLCQNNYFIQDEDYKCDTKCKDGYYPDTGTRRCTECMTNCATCEEYSISKPTCTLCKENHIFNDDTGVNLCEFATCPVSCTDCNITSPGIICNVCNPTYYMQPNARRCKTTCPLEYYPNESHLECRPCTSNCLRCKLEDTTLVCTECKERYFIGLNKTCEPCQDNCRNCLNSETCLACDNGYFIQPNGLVACDKSCKLEFYPSTIFPPACRPCFSNCLECDEDICYKCKFKFAAKPPPFDVTNACLPCAKNCINCYYENDQTVCIQCEAGFYIKSNGQTTTCEDTCPPQYYFDNQSSLCKECPIGTYGVGTGCKQCIRPCTVCSGANKCSQCIENALLVDDRCDCLSNFQFDGMNCKESYLYLDLYLINYTLLMVFEYPLKESLSSSSILLRIDEAVYYDTYFSLAMPDPSSVNIVSDIFFQNTNKTAIVIFYDASLIRDIYNHRLLRNEYSIYIPVPVNSTSTDSDTTNSTSSDLQENIPTPEQIKVEQTQAMQSTTSYSTGGSAGAGLIISLLNMNLTNMWALLNTIQILSLLPILNVTLPARTLGVCKGFSSSLNIIPNMFINLIPEYDTSIDERFREGGFKTSQFMINAGKSFTVLCVIILEYLILKIILYGINSSKGYPKLKKFIENTLVKMKWNSFLRLYIETYIEITFSAMLSLSYYSLGSPWKVADLLLSIIFLLLTFSTPFILLHFLLQNHEKLDSDNFRARYSSLYEGLNLRDTSLLFNVIFLSRRFIYCFILIYLASSPHIQIILSSLASLGSFLFILFHRPYISSKEYIFEIISEGCTVLSICLIYPFSFKLHEVVGEYLDWIIVGLIYFSFATRIMVSTVELIIKVITKLRSKCESKQNEKFGPKIIEIYMEFRR